ncbi:cysteine--tRNA ligase, partial [Staphylococcus aureus]|nr:cysteine--tRNA ligase [Staphylococcus aureus]
DVVSRYFEYQGYNVEYVSNFTDLDDKLIKRSQELNQSVPEFAEKYIAAFLEDVGALNVRKATSNPRVMDHMDDIILFINDLVDQCYAYESGGSVYFRTRKFEGYCKLSH